MADDEGAWSDLGAWYDQDGRAYHGDHGRRLHHRCVEVAGRACHSRGKYVLPAGVKMKRPLLTPPPSRMATVTQATLRTRRSPSPVRDGGGRGGASPRPSQNGADDRNENVDVQAGGENQHDGMPVLSPLLSDGELDDTIDLELVKELTDKAR